MKDALSSAPADVSKVSPTRREPQSALSRYPLKPRVRFLGDRIIFASGKNAFTLIEVLVVIAIIAILATVTIGSIGGVTARAKQAKCLSNMKQIGTALLNASFERNGQFPRAIDSPSFEYTWYSLVAPYLGITNEIRDGTLYNGKRPPGVFACPASTALVVNASGQATDYGFNGLLADSGTLRGNYIAKISQPSKILLLADTQNANPKIVGGRDIAPWNTSGLGTRHQGRCDLMYLDLHSATVNPKTVPTTDGTYPWVPSQD